MRPSATGASPTPSCNSRSIHAVILRQTRGRKHGQGCDRYRRNAGHRGGNFQGAEGCRLPVAATYHANDEAAEKFKAETGVNVYKWNVGVYDDCVAGIAEVEKELGPVDILVNNAGITKDGVFHKMTPDQWYGVINTNLNSLFNMTRPVIEGMRERGFGRIINISSLNGQKGQMGQSNYSAAKAGDMASPRRWRRKARARESRSM